MSAALAMFKSTSKEDLAKEAISARKSLRSFKEKAQEASARVMDVGLTLGGAGIAGYVDAKFPGDWMKLPKTLWIGGGLVLLALTGLAGKKATDPLLNLGNGMLSAWLYNTVRAKVV